MAASCKKESTGKKNEPYIASPQRLINMTGSSWSSVEPQLNDKKDYWYTEFSENENFAVKAAVSLKAIEETYPDINYYMLINVQRGTNKITSVNISTLDSMKKISKDEAYNLMLLYYNEGLKLMTDTSFTSGNYGNPDGTQTTTTANNILDKLKSGYESTLLSITYNTNHGIFSIALWKQNENDPYQFNFSGFTN